MIGGTRTKYVGLYITWCYNVVYEGIVLQARISDRSHGGGWLLDGFLAQHVRAVGPDSLVIEHSGLAQVTAAASEA